MGQPAMKMDDLMTKARETSAKVMTSREDARALAVKTIRILEQRLQAAIAGDTIRGLTNLAGASQFGTFQGIRVHGGPRYGIDDLLPLDGREALAVTKDGALVMACVVYAANGEPKTNYIRPVRDEELAAQDLEPFVRAIRSALERHVMRAERTTANYQRTTALAKHLTDVLAK